jgi:hypothetical protein
MVQQDGDVGGADTAETGRLAQRLWLRCHYAFASFL